MRRETLRILRCPTDRGRLRLDAREAKDDRVIEGDLACESCGQVYPVHRGVPNMLPPSLRQLDGTTPERG